MNQEDNITKVNKCFDKEWFKENYIIPIEEILHECPIIYITNNGLLKMIDIYFPIYGKFDENNTNFFL